MAVSKTNFPVLNDRIPCYRKTGNCAPIYCDDCVFRGHIQRQLRVLSIVTGGWKGVEITLPADSLDQHLLLTAEKSSGAASRVASRLEFSASSRRGRSARNTLTHSRLPGSSAWRRRQCSFSPEHPNREIRDDRQKPGQPRGRGRVRPRARAACRFRFAGGPIRREGGGRGFCTVRRSERVRE